MSNTIKAWRVKLDGEVIDTVFMHPSMSADEVRLSLIAHDGYHANITVSEDAGDL